MKAEHNPNPNRRERKSRIAQRFKKTTDIPMHDLDYRICIDAINTLSAAADPGDLNAQSILEENIKFTENLIAEYRLKDLPERRRKLELKRIGGAL